jgi:hypothetical protein
MNSDEKVNLLDVSRLINRVTRSFAIELCDLPQVIDI